MPTLKVGQSYPVNFSGSDGSTPTNVGSQPSVGGIVSVQLSTSSAVVTALAVGTTNLTYSAVGYNPTQDTVTVIPKPDLIATNGAIS